MSLLSLYFQYTHFSNIELNNLRALVSTKFGKMQLLSAKQLNTYNLSIAFGKILVIKIAKTNFNLSFVNSLLTQFTVLRLLFIEVDTFVLSPSLYLFYTSHKLQNISMYKLLCLSYCLNATRMAFFRIRYVLLSIYLLFQESLLLKTNVKYIC